MSALSLPQLIAVAILPLIFAITVHEVAHGWMAKQFGDPTAQRLGRLTLNPLKHIDPVGTVLVPALLLVLGGFIFGWAKPVPVTWENLRHPKRDMAIVAAAGPAANLLMAVFWALIVRIGVMLGPYSWAGIPMQYMGEFGIQINAVLMILNLIPLPPLDGGRVAVGLLPGPWAWQLARIEPFGFFILLALLATGVLGTIIGPPINMVMHLVSLAVGLG
ncbi:MAG TPA: site-2 protease family protein [Candidatus Methylomirabilis sp.]|nr:site-2 protease family protein [Candidatus Methylomirabilis sp.]